MKLPVTWKNHLVTFYDMLVYEHSPTSILLYLRKKKKKCQLALALSTSPYSLVGLGQCGGSRVFFTPYAEWVLGCDFSGPGPPQLYCVNTSDTSVCCGLCIVSGDLNLFPSAKLVTGTIPVTHLNAPFPTCGHHTLKEMAVMVLIVT